MSLKVLLSGKSQVQATTLSIKNLCKFLKYAGNSACLGILVYVTKYKEMKANYKHWKEQIKIHLGYIKSIEKLLFFSFIS